MEIALIALLSLAVLYLALRLHHLHNSINALSACISERRHSLSPTASGSIGRLERAYNELLARHEQTRRAGEGHHRQVDLTLASLREAVLLVGDDNCIHLVNTALSRLLHLPPVQPGARLESVFHSGLLLDYVMRVKQGQTSAPETFEYDGPGGPIWFEVSGSLLPKNGSSEQLALFVLHDITKLKSLERVRRDFVANVSHELRTPVTIIKGFADTLVEDHEVISVGERERFLAKIQKNVARLHDLLEDLLLLSRLESSERLPRKEVLSLGALAREVADNFRPRLAPSGRTLRYELHAEDDEVPMNALRITQVVENLLENALRHARGFKQLTVRTESTSHGVWCTLEDDGCGIPEADLPHLFERFYRVDKGRGRDSGGTGLGLSIVKHIVNQHGGTVTARSQVGEGSAFAFFLPYSKTRRPKPPRPTEPDAEEPAVLVS